MRAIQITFDAIDPLRLGTFWAEVLHYQLEPPPAGHSSWGEFLTSIGIPETEHNRACAVVDPDGKGPRIYFQRVDEARKSAGLHLDITVGLGPTHEERRRKIDAEAERLVGLGAQPHRVVDRDREYWVVLRDPEGNPFCLQ